MTDDDKETTETVSDSPKVTTETVSDSPKETAHDDGALTKLQERVSLLEETVQSLIPQERDESPVRKPWTHRGSWGR